MPKKTALITGGNRGLGLESGRQLAQRGFRVLLASRGDAGAEASALNERGLEVVARSLDVTAPQSIEALCDRLRRDGEELDVLINNAGVALDGFDADVVRRTLAVNFFGAMHATDALLPFIREGGAIVMVSSGLGALEGLPAELARAFTDPKLERHALMNLIHQFVHQVERGTHRQNGWPSSAYRVSKIGLNALARVMATELAPRRIRVNAVCPGWVRTDMGGESAPRSVEEGAASIVADAVIEGRVTGRWFRDGSEIEW